MSELVRLREAVGLTQEQLAELAGTSQPQINRLETGARKMSIKWAKLLAPHLKTTPATLMFPDEMGGLDKMLSEFPPELADEADLIREDLKQQIKRQREMLERARHAR